MSLQAMPRTTSRRRPPAGGEAAALIDGARHDLDLAETILAAGGDRLLALAAVARAAKRADDATFVLLDEPAAARTQNP